MSYYTEYTIGIKENNTEKPNDELINEIIDTLLVIVDFKPYIDESFELSYPWSEQDEHMLTVSDIFKDVVFCVRRKGEELEDLSNTYYLNGKRQYCRAEIKIPDFDINKLM